MASEGFFFNFREAFEKCIANMYIEECCLCFRQILNFLEKVVYFRQILDHFYCSYLASLSDDQVGITSRDVAAV